MNRPLPRPTAETRPFWDGCAAGVLRYQACTQCGAVQPIPRGVCARCKGDDLAWRDSAGLGTVLSHTTVHRAPSAAFRQETPYVIALVDMDEGFRLMANVQGGAEAPVAIGARVRIGFRQVEGVAMPHAEMTP
jgi:uncharacterized OB-fold protein